MQVPTFATTFARLRWLMKGYSIRDFDVFDKYYFLNVVKYAMGVLYVFIYIS